MEDKEDIEAKNESVVEERKDTKKKESIRDIFRDKRNKKPNKSKFEKKESNNANKYYNQNEAFSGNENKYYNSNKKYINNDRQLYQPGSNSSKDNYYNQNPKYSREFNPNNKYQYNNYSYKGNNSYKYNNNKYNYQNNFTNSSNKKINNDTQLDNQNEKKYNYNYQKSNKKFNDNLEYQPKRFYGKINLSSNDQYKVKRPYNYQEKKEEEPEPETEKVTFFNSKLDLNKENSNLKELDTKEDLFLNKFMKATNNTSLGFSSSKENSMQNIPPIKQDKDKKIKINYEDMEVENRDDFEINDDKKEKNKTEEITQEVKK